jgi:hypothetical protein
VCVHAFLLLAFIKGADLAALDRGGLSPVDSAKENGHAGLAADLALLHEIN